MFILFQFPLFEDFFSIGGRKTLVFYYQKQPPKWYKPKRQPTGHQQAQAKGNRPPNGT